MPHFKPKEATPMKMSSLVAVALISAAVMVVPARTQETTKKGGPPSPAASPSTALLKQWNEIGRKLTAMSEDFPENKYDFKAAPSARTFAERLIHAAAANYYFTNLALGQKAPGEEDPPRAQFKDKTALVAYVRKSFADGGEIPSLGNAFHCYPPNTQLGRPGGLRCAGQWIHRVINRIF
jgi:hypothetical protein